MTPKTYDEWKPDEFDPGSDQLSAQAGERESEAVVRDPEIDAPPQITRVGNTPPQPVNVELDRSVSDPSAPPQVTRLELRSHLEAQPATDDRFGDTALDREARR
jgi:hypothetical protein